MERCKLVVSNGHIQADFWLREYLVPGGKYPYSELAEDMEQALQIVDKVYLWSVPGFLMVSGYQGGEFPWHSINADTWHKSAKEALRA